jgi:hypothetical protein
MRLSEDSERKPAQEWTASHTKSMKRMPRGTSNSFMSAQRGQVPSPTAAQDLYPQGKWQGATYLHTVFGGQDRAEGDGRSAKRYL